MKRSKARVPFTSWCCNIVIGNGSHVIIMGVTYVFLNGRGCEEIVFEHLQQLASPNLDSDNQESVFDRVADYETCRTHAKNTFTLFAYKFVLIM